MARQYKIKEEYYDKCWKIKFAAITSFVNQFKRLPEPHETHEGHNIGKWLTTQRYLYDSGKLLPEYVEKLDRLNAEWNGTKSNREKFDSMNRVLLRGLWKKDVPNGNTPLDLIYDEEDLELCISKGFVDCESLIDFYLLKLSFSKKKRGIDCEWINDLTHFNIWDLIELVIPFADSIYTALLRAITIFDFPWEDVENLDDLRDLLYQFPYRTKHDMIVNIEMLLKNSLSEEDIAYIKNNHIITGKDIREDNNYSRTTNILTILRHKYKQYLFNTHTILDCNGTTYKFSGSFAFPNGSVELPLFIKSFLYRNSIVSMFGIREFVDKYKETNPQLCVSIYEWLYALSKEIIDKYQESTNLRFGNSFGNEDDPFNVTLSTLNLSERVLQTIAKVRWKGSWISRSNEILGEHECNGSRVKYITISEFIRLCDDIKNGDVEVSGIGKTSINMIIDEVNKYLEQKGYQSLMIDYTKS